MATFLIVLVTISPKKSGIEKYIIVFQRLKRPLEKMLGDPACNQDEEYMGFVLAGFQQLRLARSEINYQALNGIYIPIG